MSGDDTPRIIRPDEVRVGDYPLTVLWEPES